MKTPCYVVTYHDYESNDWAWVYYNKETAKNEVLKDIVSVLRLLEKSGYEWTRSEMLDDRWEVWAKDININYEWSIIETTIE